MCVCVCVCVFVCVCVCVRVWLRGIITFVDEGLEVDHFGIVRSNLFLILLVQPFDGFCHIARVVDDETEDLTLVELEGFHHLFNHFALSPEKGDCFVFKMST